VIFDLGTQTQPFGQRRACRIVRSAYPGGGIDCTSLEMASRETQELADLSLTSNRRVRGRPGRLSLSLGFSFSFPPLNLPFPPIPKWFGPGPAPPSEPAASPACWLQTALRRSRGSLTKIPVLCRYRKLAQVGLH
jgi:hypothetical protein